MMPPDTFRERAAGADVPAQLVTTRSATRRSLMVLDEYERIGAENPAWDRRWRSSTRSMAAKDFERMAALGVNRERRAVSRDRRRALGGAKDRS